MLTIFQRRFPSVSSSWDTTHNSEHWGNLFPLVLICYRRVVVCLSAVGALQRRGQACSGAAAARRTANTCGAFHGSGPSNFNGKLHIFHGYIPAREGRTRREGGMRVGGWSHTGGGWWWTVPSSSCASQALHFTAEGSGSFGPAAGCSKADGVRCHPETRLRDWTERWKTQSVEFMLFEPTQGHRGILENSQLLFIYRSHYGQVSSPNSCFLK